MTSAWAGPGRGDTVDAIFVQEDNRYDKRIGDTTLQFRVETGTMDLDHRTFAMDKNEENIEVLRKIKNTATNKVKKMIREGKFTVPEGAKIGKNATVEITINRIRTINAKKRSETVTTEGKRLTKYFIISESDRLMPKWEDGYPSQTEARKNLKQDLSVGGHQEIIAITRREDGSPLVTHDIVGYATKTVEVEVNVNVYLRVTRDTAPRTGWMFIGKGRY